MARIARFRADHERTEFYLLVDGRPDEKTEILTLAERDAYLDSLVK
jgi:hypothetical protein